MCDLHAAFKRDSSGALGNYEDVILRLALRSRLSVIVLDKSGNKKVTVRSVSHSLSDDKSMIVFITVKTSRKLLADVTNILNCIVPEDKTRVSLRLCHETTKCNMGIPNSSCSLKGKKMQL